jgi:ferredoxin-NADP reductase
MTAIRTGLDTLGVPAGRVHTEAFGAEDPITPGIVPHAARPPHPPKGIPGNGPARVVRA